MTDLKQLEEQSRAERAEPADILKAASTVDLEAHRFLQLVRNHYAHGELHLADIRDLMRALEQAADILRHQRLTLRESCREHSR